MLRCSFCFLISFATCDKSEQVGLGIPLASLPSPPNPATAHALTLCTNFSDSEGQDDKQMTDKNSRYSGPPTVRQSYMDEFIVECPQCGKEASVKVDRPRWLDSGKLVCNNCMYSETGDNLIRYKSIVKRNCDNCGKTFETTLPNKKEKVDEMTIACPHCGTTRNYKPKHEEYRIGYDNKGQASDPIFNLPLWFQADVRGNLFWAYNRDHLSEIKAYVTSKLREGRQRRTRQWLRDFQILLRTPKTVTH